MRTLPALVTGLTAALALAVGVAVEVTADDAPRSERVPVSATVEDEGPGTETVPEEPRYACQDGVCDTYGESSEGPGTD